MTVLDVAVTREAGGWDEGAGALAERAARAAAAEFWSDEDGPAELSVVLADDALVHRLNREYRGKDRPTNVLSFALTEGDTPAAGPGVPVLLGDVVLAWETVAREAGEQGKSIDAHFNHLVVHGVLHLLGYDHESEPDAEEMERLEVAILARLGVADPYAGSPSPDTGSPAQDEPSRR
jgi:probable rRNA maturation factor